MIKGQKVVSDLGDNHGNNVKLTDGDIDTYYSSDKDGCYVGWDFGEKNVATITSLRFFLKIGAKFDKFIGTKVETSDDGTAWTLLTTMNEVIEGGWNFW